MIAAIPMLRTQAHQLARAALAVLALVSLASAQEGNREPVLPPGCEALKAPAGNQVSFHVFAMGVQIYRWNGTAWVFVAPVALLFADAGYHAQVGIHYAGPTWESGSKSNVVGARLQGASPDPTAIPWLLLRAVSTQGPGPFDGTTFIQRVSTTGGLAPGRAGSLVGEEVSVPYTAEYFFYRAQD
jgi:hypothetical protein